MCNVADFTTDPECLRIAVMRVEPDAGHPWLLCNFHGEGFALPTLRCHGDDRG